MKRANAFPILYASLSLSSAPYIPRMSLPLKMLILVFINPKFYILLYLVDFVSESTP